MQFIVTKTHPNVYLGVGYFNKTTYLTNYSFVYVIIYRIVLFVKSGLVDLADCTSWLMRELMTEERSPLAGAGL